MFNETKRVKRRTREGGCCASFEHISSNTERSRPSSPRINVSYANNVSVYGICCVLYAVCVRVYMGTYVCVCVCMNVCIQTLGPLYLRKNLSSCPPRHTHIYARPPLLYLLSVPSHFSLSILFSFPVLGPLVLLSPNPKRPHAISLSVRHAGPTNQPTSIRYIRTCIHV